MCRNVKARDHGSRAAAGLLSAARNAILYRESLDGLILV
jgi:hypothetical protein